MQDELSIRPAHPDDAKAIWAIVEPVIRAGETYAIDRDVSREDALRYWMGSDRSTFVAEVNGTAVGTYYLRPNHGGGGSHVCNCGYMVAEAASGRGFARRMCEHSIVSAREQGFLGMQFNFVVSTNVHAIRLWSRCGFETVGRLPNAFRHPADGFVDALVMFRAI
jgi:ribosomal protein S18 acetylase RimI-like enzyme